MCRLSTNIADDRICTGYWLSALKNSVQRVFKEKTMTISRITSLTFVLALGVAASACGGDKSDSSGDDGTTAGEGEGLSHPFTVALYAYT